MIQTAQNNDNSRKSIADRPRRSEKLSDAEFDLFKERANSFLTQRDAAEYFGFSTVTLVAIMLKNGQGSPDSISKIREKLQ